LGCGNGILSELILEKLPNSTLVGFDITEGMLESYSKKISGMTPNFETILGDYRTDDFGNDWDIIVSGMTLHHLAYGERKAIYDRFYASMNSGGVYISNDILLDEDSEVATQQYKLWKSFMKSNGEDPEFWHEKHLEKDHPVTLSQQFEWLRSSGFIDVGCYWRFINFGIVKCSKP
jgi:tRNA (cmo5U34)-methyltransferase